MVDFGNFIDRKWTVGAHYYWLSPGEYNSLPSELQSGFSVNEDGNYYILESNISDDQLNYLLDEDMTHYWKAVNSHQGATGH